MCLLKILCYQIKVFLYGVQTRRGKALGGGAIFNKEDFVCTYFENFNPNPNFEESNVGIGRGEKECERLDSSHLKAITI